LVLSAMAVFLRDLQHAVGLLTSVLFFLTPVFYPESMIPARVWHYWQFVNPLAYVSSQFRRVVVLGAGPDWPSLLLLTTLCAAALWLAASWFAAVRRRFADVI
jgi:lipopolysaccharide transport system permease protein